MEQSANDNLNPYYRSMQLLRNTVDGSDSLQWDDEEFGNVEIYIRGMSRRWYRINAHRMSPESLGDKKKSHWTSSWAIGVRGASWKSDFKDNFSLTASICIHTNRNGSRLPIGDSLVSLCLSLINDKITSLDVPLLAQFIVCPRNRLSNIEIFQEEGIVTTEMISGADDFFGEWDGEWDEDDDDIEFLNEQNMINAYFAQLGGQPEVSCDEIKMENEIMLKEEKMANDYDKMIFEHERAADRVADRDSDRQY